RTLRASPVPTTSRHRSPTTSAACAPASRCCSWSIARRVIEGGALAPRRELCQIRTGHNHAGEPHMKGYATPSSPFARKVRMAAIETGQGDLIEWRMLTREERPKVVPPFNPLGKVPVVVLDSGEALYDSPVICAYVDSLHGGPKLIPEEGKERWRAL